MAAPGNERFEASFGIFEPSFSRAMLQITNGGTVNLEGPGLSGKQRTRRACVRWAQRITPSRAREKEGQNGGGDQNSGIGLTGG